MIRIRTNWNNGLLLKVSSITHSIVISTSDDLTGAGVLLKVAFDALIYWKYLLKLHTITIFGEW